MHASTIQLSQLNTSSFKLRDQLDQLKPAKTGKAP